MSVRVSASVVFLFFLLFIYTAALKCIVLIIILSHCVTDCFRIHFTCHDYLSKQHLLKICVKGTTTMVKALIHSFPVLLKTKRVREQ